jgi:hypothetical protein
MLAGTFAQRLRKVNPRLRIASGDNRDRPAGLYFMQNGEEESVCGIDYNDVPERMVVDAQTKKILKGGWQRTCRIILKRGLASKDRILRQFPGFREYAMPPIVVGTEKTEVAEAIKKMFMERFDPELNAPKVKTDEIMDFAKALRK